MLYYTFNTIVNKIVAMYNVLTIDYSHILASYILFFIIILVIYYDQFGIAT